MTDPIETSTKPFIGALSIEAQLLRDHLKAHMGVDLVTYAALSEIAGRDVQRAGRGPLDTARRILQREDNIVFGVVRGEGLKRLSDPEIVKAGHASVAATRRTARRGIRKLACADYANLDNGDRISHNTVAELSRRVYRKLGLTGSALNTAGRRLGLTRDE